MVSGSRMLMRLVLCLCVSTPVLAEYSYGPVSLNAFGTFGGAWLSNSHADYTNSLAQPSGPGKSWGIDPALDSRLGGQLNISPTMTTLITAQAVAERLPDGQFLPRLTLANIRQEILNDFAIRIGRVQIPIYLASDYRLANFSNPWVRPPKEIYGLYSVQQHDGVDVSYTHDMPWGQLTLNSGYGWYDQAVPADNQVVTFKYRDIYYVTARMDQGPWRLKLSMLHNTTEWTPNFSLANLVATGIPGAGGLFADPKAAAQWAVGAKGYAVYSVGLSYDAEDWLFMGEWAYTSADTMAIFPEQHGGYLTAGYHFGRFMPQVTLSYQAAQNRRTFGNNPFSDAVIKGIADALKYDHHTVAFGLNYAATDNVILRGQVDLIQPDNGSYGPYNNVDYAKINPNNPSLDKLVSFTVDFIY